MGPGEDLIDRWIRWFLALSPSDRQEHLATSHAPDVWSSFAEELVAQFGTNGTQGQGSS